MLKRFCMLCRAGHAGVVRVLLAGGADAKLPNKAGLNAADVAMEGGRSATVAAFDDLAPAAMEAAVLAAVERRKQAVLKAAAAAAEAAAKAEAKAAAPGAARAPAKAAAAADGAFYVPVLT